MKKAFTMLELVFVIVVIGIISAVLIPRVDSQPSQQAALDLRSEIRYTQHLAMNDDSLNPNDSTWYKNRWQIRFKDNKYSIVHNNNTEYAKDPLKPDVEVKNIDLHKKYGVSITVTGTECGVAAGDGSYIISFDHLGRPIAGDLNNATGPYSGTGVSLVQTNDCNITLSNDEESASLSISPETGFVKLSYN